MRRPYSQALLSDRFLLATFEPKWNELCSTRLFIVLRGGTGCERGAQRRLPPSRRPRRGRLRRIAMSPRRKLTPPRSSAVEVAQGAWPS